MNAQLEGEANYFGTALAMFHRLDLDDNVSKIIYKGVPVVWTYFRTALMERLQPIHNANITIVCRGNSSNGITLLYAIQFCFDTNLEPTNCKYNTKGCPLYTRVRWPYQ